MTLDDLRRPLLARMASSVLGLAAFVVSDRDGVVLFKCVPENNTNSSEIVERLTSTPYLCRYWACADAAARLVDQSENEFMMTSFSKMSVVQVNQSPVVLTLLGHADECVVGQLLDFAKEMAPMVSDIAKVCVRE